MNIVRLTLEDGTALTITPFNSNSVLNTIENTIKKTLKNGSSVSANDLAMSILVALKEYATSCTILLHDEGTL